MAGITSVLVTGGTGKTGRHVTQALEARGVAYRIAARRPPPTDRAIRFDWMDESSFGEALSGVDSVYLVAPAGVPDPLPPMSAFIRLALDRGVKRFVLMSSSAVPIDGPVMGGVHRFLADNAPEWTVIRPSWFFENFTEEHHGETIRREDSIYSATGDAPIAFIGAKDIGEACAACLCGDHVVNDDPVLTGPASHSYDDMARIISEQAGRPIRHVRLSQDELARKFTQFGLDESYAKILAHLDGFLAGGSEARTTGDVARLTGRPATPFQEFAIANKGRWDR